MVHLFGGKGEPITHATYARALRDRLKHTPVTSTLKTDDYFVCQGDTDGFNCPETRSCSHLANDAVVRAKATF